MELTLSKKQNNLRQDIISPNIDEIYVLGSVQSGKTYCICEATLEYAQELYKYKPDEEFQGAIIGWTIDTLKSNIVENFMQIFKKLGFKQKDKRHNGDYDLNWGSSDEKYLKIWNFKIFFFGFNNQVSFNKILGKPLLFIWCDESARIYSSYQLQDSFDQLPGRQMSYANNPYLKTIHSFNVEGGDRHPYKLKFIDGKPNAIHYTFFPYDNPKIDTKEAIDKILNMFASETLKKQKVFNQWTIAEGKVFNQVNIIHNLDGLVFREIGIGIDYGSVNPTTFVPIVLCYNQEIRKWVLVRLQIYYHIPQEEHDNPTTEYYSRQLRLFIYYLKKIYPQVPITNIVIDSEASHFDNRLTVDGIEHETSKKGPGSVDAGVQHLQSLIQKGYYYIYDQPSIKHIQENGEIVLSGKDEGLIEMDSYQYDSVTSSKTGENCYKKELDHHIDATRYEIEVLSEQGKCPIV